MAEAAILAKTVGQRNLQAVPQADRQSGGHVDLSRARLWIWPLAGNLDFASWNRIGKWLRRVGALRDVA
jgi:hypothetical protein